MASTERSSSDAFPGTAAMVPVAAPTWVNVTPTETGMPNSATLAVNGGTVRLPLTCCVVRSAKPSNVAPLGKVSF